MSEICMNGIQKYPKWLLDILTEVPVHFINFEGEQKSGSIIVHRDLEEDISFLFAEIFSRRFPIHQVTPLSHLKFRFSQGWSDEISMQMNNTCGFNFRKISPPGTNLAGIQKKWSLHALGLAIDLNPMQNPWICNAKTVPQEAEYKPEQSGTIVANGWICTLLKSLMWEWGGDFSDSKDYHHFQKKISDFADLMNQLKEWENHADQSLGLPGQYRNQ